MSFNMSDLVDVEIDEEQCTLIPRPATAFTARPSTRPKFTMPSELTPPPSPDREDFLSGFKVSPLLNRATSFISRKNIAVRPNSRELTASTPDRQSSPTKRNRNPAFTDLFNGSSAPMTFGFIPSPKKEDGPEDSPFSSTRAASPMKRSSTLQTAVNLLGFGSKSTGERSPRRSYDDSDDEDDPFLSMDVKAELFSRGRTGHMTFDELLHNAEGLLASMQRAYREKHHDLQEATATYNVEQDELDEARMRASHLKLQLDGMSAKVADQELQMKSLTNELAEERQKSYRSAASKDFSVRLVSPEGQEQLDVERLFSRGSKASLYDFSSASDDSLDTDSVFSSRPPSASPSRLSATTFGGNQLSRAASRESYTQRSSLVQMSEENRRLKARVTELEEAVSGCLGLVDAF